MRKPQPAASFLRRMWCAHGSRLLAGLLVGLAMLAAAAFVAAITALARRIP